MQVWNASDIEFGAYSSNGDLIFATGKYACINAVDASKSTRVRKESELLEGVYLNKEKFTLYAKYDNAS